MLLPVFPLARVLPPVSPSVDAEAILLIVVIFALVATTVWPSEDALAVHVVVLPFTSKNFAVGPSVSADTRDKIIAPVSIIDGTICILVLSLPVLLSSGIHALKHGRIWPRLFSFAMLQIIFPLSHKSGSIRRGIKSLAMGLAVLPKPLVVVTILVPEFSFAIWFIIVPFSLVLVTVFEYFGACPSPFVVGVKVPTI